MSDEVWRRDEVESPCVRICLLHPQAGICIGCYRTAEEIAGWSTMTPEARRAVMAELPGRAHLVKPVRRGGRAGRRGGG
ncbi:DUF1289 domain-containing protein [Amaricoccus sp.]|uniref:DUF1289 domain-containing protein n=1 Tax=Amaricoccus sp. TaxID=1872485 RepID=UPI00260E4F27|nr:DUF1289 domain-containing protein [Amaricoccus sp.]HRO11990.1 DUF1289 domain-containing protein [Amaricoccus sp.]